MSKTFYLGLVVLFVVLCAVAQTDPKQLSLYGCTPLFANALGYSSDFAKVCKIYDPETHRHFIIGVVDDSKGGGIAIVPIDNGGAR